jgi:hypothetical protein
MNVAKTYVAPVYPAVNIRLTSFSLTLLSALPSTMPLESLHLVHLVALSS